MTLIDSHGREIRSVRISVTDRCNYRCLYCMPDGLLDVVDREEILSSEEIIRIVGILTNEGVRHVKLTGGEPTIRRNLVELCHEITNLYHSIELSMTTNGSRLLELAPALKQAGVKQLNISLDSFNREKFHEVTQRDDLENILKGIELALDLGFHVKLNAVSIKSFNDDDESLLRFIEFSQRTGVEVRFIELMPFTGNHWSKDGFISSAELRDRIEKIVKLHQVERNRPSETSTKYSFNGGKLGFISSVSESFCANCDRIRITAEGSLRPCLHSSKEFSFREMMRNGATDDEIIEFIRKGISRKWKEHPDFLSQTFLPPIDDREMIRIGG